jgi:hypothetical protein
MADDQRADAPGGDLLPGLRAHLAGDQIRADSTPKGPGSHGGLGDGHGHQVRQPGEPDHLTVTPADREPGRGGSTVRNLAEQAQARGQPEPLRGTFVEVCVTSHIGYSNHSGCRIGRVPANFSQT